MAQSFHPVVEYLDRVASDENIVPAELDQLGALFWDTQDPLYDAMIRKTVIGAVKRAYEPGCMFRTCLVFKGGQDIGKSTSIRVLASPAWLTDTAQDKHEDFLLAIHGCWIYELAELDSITSKKEAGALKTTSPLPKTTSVFHTDERMTRSLVKAFLLVPVIEMISSVMKRVPLGFGSSSFRTTPMMAL